MSKTCGWTGTRHLWNNSCKFRVKLCLLYDKIFLLPTIYALDIWPHFWILSNENTLLLFVIRRLTRDKAATYFEPTAKTLALDQARIYYQLISHSCFLQVCRNVGLNGDLQLRSKILVNLLCCPQLFLPLHPQNVPLGKNPTDKARLENQPKFQLFVLLFLTSEELDYFIILLSILDWQ